MNGIRYRHYLFTHFHSQLVVYVDCLDSSGFPNVQQEELGKITAVVGKWGNRLGGDLVAAYLPFSSDTLTFLHYAAAIRLQ